MTPGTQVGCFVLIGSSEHSLVDARDYFRPVVTPFELVLALGSGQEWTGEYLLDYAPLLPRLAAAAEAAEAASAASARKARGGMRDGAVGGGENTGVGNGVNTEGVGGGDTGGGDELGSDEDAPPEHSLLSGRLIGAGGCAASHSASASRDTGGGALVPAGTLASGGGAVAVGGPHTVARTGAEFLSQRSWRGLEVRAGEDAPAGLQAGRRGIASGFAQEGEGGGAGRRGGRERAQPRVGSPGGGLAGRGQEQSMGATAGGGVPRVRAGVLATSASAIVARLRVS